MKKINYSAPAKVILTGEHAVVYGKPALVSALDKRLTVSVAEGRGRYNDVNIPEIISVIKKYLQVNKHPITEKISDVVISSDIPIGRGLGSSGALSVASSAALMEFFTGRQFTPEEINNCAYQVEKIFHKNASGVDPTTSCFGGLIFYRKEFEFLKTFSSLHIKIPKQISENLLLIDSGKPTESTLEMVQSVGDLYNKKVSFTEKALSQIEKTTKRMVISLIKEDREFFKQTIIDNEKLLETIGVVSQSTKNLFKTLKPFGVGKITGGGGRKTGSGFTLFYSDRKSDMESYLKKRKINYLLFTPSFEGVKKIT